jgi:thioredoxin 1
MKRSEMTFAVLTLTVAFAAACGKEPPAGRDASIPPSSAAEATGQAAKAPSTPGFGQVLVTNRLDIDFSKHRVTFIELGADRCIPCKAMQPVMKEIAETYADRVQVVFYDVWKDPAPARKYGIQLIPTQVFIDREGKEIFRHVGFYAKDEILKTLKEKGLL